MNATFQGTPGPWIVEHCGDRIEIAVEENLFTVATLRTSGHSRRNAALIAQAPVMLDVLQQVFGMLAQPDGEDHVDKCITAIAPIIESLRKGGAL